MSQARPDPSQIMQVGMGFWASKTLLSAVELELFTELDAEALTGGDLQDDATMVCLDWYGGPPRRRNSEQGADPGRASSLA